MSPILDNFLNVDVLWHYGPLLLRGLGYTVLLSLLAIPLGAAGGLCLAMLSTDSKRWLRWPAVAFVDLMRAFPPLVLLILISAGLPHLGLQIPPLAALLIALLVNSSSYYGEIFRAGFLSVPTGVMEAARATGLGYFRSTAFVLVPISVRNVAPDLLSNTLELVKLTSIGAIVTIVELTQAARVAQGLSFNGTPIIAAAALYFILLWPLARFISRLEQRSLAGP